MWNIQREEGDVPSKLACCRIWAGRLHFGKQNQKVRVGYVGQSTIRIFLFPEGRISVVWNSIDSACEMFLSSSIAVFTIACGQLAEPK